FSNNQRQGDEKCWYNLSYPKFKATVHLSYKPVENNISSYIEDSRNFAVKHQIKATGMNESVIIRDSARVFGLMYDIEGNTASSLQFYITDSTKHFMRGALYFDARTNIDSLKIVIDFIRQDILHLIETASWKS
ncbi:MAG: gliding motility lipoprotein GldD, partial [Bacteroidia bacterium]